jgi:lysyl endopeptidase
LKTSLTLAVLVTTTLALLSLGGSFVAAGQPPVSHRSAAQALPIESVPLLELPPVDNQRALAAAKQAALDAPLQFGVAQPTLATPATDGTWESLPSGAQLWRLRVRSQGAVSLNLGFTRYVMPPGGHLNVYDPSLGLLHGPYTAADNEAHGQLWTPLLLGDEAVIEVELPAATPREQLQLVLSSVGHGFQDPFNPLVEKSGSCNVDVVCPQGEPWRSQIRSVARMIFTFGGGTYTCTGALINNTAQDKRPFFLTAEHCDIDAGNAPTVVTYWNFESPICRTPGSPASGGPGGGSESQTMSGAIWRAEYPPSDMTLLELDDAVPEAYNPYWAGWDRGAGAPSGAVAIHHPQGDEKRISFENDPTTITSYLGTASPGNGNYLRVIDWDLGTTEVGSSGSPLFNPAGLVVGQLHGGGAACGNNQSDWYGRLYASWSGGGALGTRLSDYLDPVGSGVTALEGTDGRPPLPLTPYSYLPGVQR